MSHFPMVLTNFIATECVDLDKVILKLHSVHWRNVLWGELNRKIFTLKYNFWLCCVAAWNLSIKEEKIKLFRIQLIVVQSIQWPSAIYSIHSNIQILPSCTYFLAFFPSKRILHFSQFVSLNLLPTQSNTNSSSFFFLALLCSSPSVFCSKNNKRFSEYQQNLELSWEHCDTWHRARSGQHDCLGKIDKSFSITRERG